VVEFTGGLGLGGKAKVMCFFKSKVKKPGSHEQKKIESDFQVHDGLSKDEFYW
jgi:hypothetical protein